MKSAANNFRYSIGSEKGATMLEYSTIAALIILACIFAIQLLGERTSSSFTTAGTAMGGGTIGTSGGAVKVSQE